MQDTDGGIKNENLNSRIWETAYVVSTLSGKTWNEVLQKFEKREIPKTIPKPKTPQKTKKIEPKIEKEISATVIEEVPEPPKGWFKKLLENIFGF